MLSKLLLLSAAIFGITSASSTSEDVIYVTNSPDSVPGYTAVYRVDPASGNGYVSLYYPSVHINDISLYCDIFTRTFCTSVSPLYMMIS